MSEVQKSVLIVDDSELIIERISEMLQEMEMVKLIIAAKDFDSAIKMMSQNNPDIVLLDIQLPGKNGIELLEFIVKNHSSTNVIMVTNNVSESYRKKCKKLGASYFIDKSKDFELLPGIIRSVNKLN